MGSSFRMGPGYFPTILSWLMVALGAVDGGAGAGGRRTRTARSGMVPWRALVLIVGATVLFGLALRGLGLGPVLLLVVFATAWASRYASLKASPPLALGIALFCSGLFIKGLGLPLAADRPLAERRLLVAARRRPPPQRRAATAPAQ